jgi:hypothetical protein
MTAKVIDGRKIAKNILQNVAKDIKYIKSNYQIKPNITTIMSLTLMKKFMAFLFSFHFLSILLLIK